MTGLRCWNQRGQVLVMVTVVLLAMCGVLGLAIDLGWSYFVKRSAQVAVDAAALAAAEVAFEKSGPMGPYNCGVKGVTCTAQPASCANPVPNPPATNLDNGCLYAEQNGFTFQGEASRQNVTMEAGVSSQPPTAPGVACRYWVTARAAERIPQLFSSVLGNTWGISSARATAAIVKSAVTGSLILLNRQNDCMPMEGGQKLQCGVDLLVQANDNKGMYAVQADGGILMASTNNGVNNPDGFYAGWNQGGGTVFSPYTYIRGDGWYWTYGSSSWIQTPENQKPDSHLFKDPMRGRYQPPPPVNLTEPAAYPNGVPNGVISGGSDPANPLVLEPGAYYASFWDGTKWYATGDPIRIMGAVHFSKGNLPFAEYVFFGGLSATNMPGAPTELTVDPGRYVVAGVRPRPNGTAGKLFDITTNLVMTDGSPAFTPNSGPNAHPGEVFIFTDLNYVGYDWTTGTKVPLTIPQRVLAVKNELKFGISGFQAGNNTEVVINLHGLNRQSSVVPESLKSFDAPLLVWHDQNNSVIKYYDDPSEPSTFNEACVVSDTVCANTRLDSNTSPELFLKASPGSSIYGVMYQPRGAWTTIGGGSGYAGPLQVIAGGFKVQGNAALTFVPLNEPILAPMVALVE